MSKSAAKVLPETYPMNGGDGTYSYTKNSQFQKAASSIAKSMIDEAIADKLDINDFTSSSNDNIFRIADLGCSVGPNTFTDMQNILEAVQKKYQSQNKPEFQVFFNDHASNDFNTLFSSLPAEKNYFEAGVPGSFHGRLFPKSSLHFVHSSIALHWLSKVPEELLDKNSPAWNRGRIHYTNASDEVCKAYSSQFHKDIEKFLDARAKEIVAGGMMVLIMPSLPEGIPCSCVPSGVMFDLLGSCLVDMAKDGLISEDEVDSFNLPVYAASAKEMTQLIQRNGCFSIERMKLLRSNHLMAGIQITMQALTMHLRAGFEGIISKHFGSGIVDELFVRFHKKIGMGDVAIWIRVAGKIDKSCKYFGGEYEMLLVKSHVKYGGLRNMVAEMLNVNDSVRNMQFKFEIGHLVRPLYGVTDERTFELYMHHTRQDSMKYSLLVTLEEESVRYGQGSNEA